jgi:hypothetical protein
MIYKETQQVSLSLVSFYFQKKKTHQRVNVMIKRPRSNLKQSTKCFVGYRLDQNIFLFRRKRFLSSIPSSLGPYSEFSSVKFPISVRILHGDTSIWPGVRLGTWGKHSLHPKLCYIYNLWLQLNLIMFNQVPGCVHRFDLCSQS